MTWFEEFKKIRDEMLREIKNMFNDNMINLSEFKDNQPLMYGYSIYIGPDGVPVIKEFGNFKPNNVSGLKRSSGFEPYIDTLVDDEKKTFTVTAEMPGVDKKDITVKVVDKGLMIKSATEGRQFERTVPIKAVIDPESIKATYKNGILEVTGKIKEGSTKEFDVKIE